MLKTEIHRSRIVREEFRGIEDKKTLTKEALFCKSIKERLNPSTHTHFSFKNICSANNVVSELIYKDCAHLRPRRSPPPARCWCECAGTRRRRRDGRAALRTSPPPWSVRPPSPGSGRPGAGSWARGSPARVSETDKGERVKDQIRANNLSAKVNWDFYNFFLIVQHFYAVYCSSCGVFVLVFGTERIYLLLTS